MNENETNGVPPAPSPPGPQTDEEWERFWADVEAKTPRHMTDEELELVEDARWAEDDPEIQEKYADQVVAVRNRRIIASGEDLLEVLAEAERVTGLPRHRIAVTTIYGPKHFLQDY